MYAIIAAHGFYPETMMSVVSEMLRQISPFTYIKSLYQTFVFCGIQPAATPKKKFFLRLIAASIIL